MPDGVARRSPDCAGPNMHHLTEPTPVNSKVAIIDVAVDALDIEDTDARPGSGSGSGHRSPALTRSVVSQSPKWFLRGDMTSGAEHRSDTGLLVEMAVLDTSQSRDVIDQRAGDYPAFTCASTRGETGPGAGSDARSPVVRLVGRLSLRSDRSLCRDAERLGC